MTTHSLVKVTGLNRFFGATHAVKDLSFELRKGEVLGFLGPNGAGKSTTMKMLCGALAPSSGQVLIDGHDLFMSPLQAKRELGYLPESPPLYPDLTVDEYLNFCCQIRGIRSTRERSRAVEEAKRRCGLTLVGRRLLGTLSKGFRQRAGIAQAILHGPSVVVLDEPTSGLDPIQIREIRTLIEELRDEHSVLLSTHILPEVTSVCDRVLILHEGRLVLDSPLAHIAPDTASLRLELESGPDESEVCRKLSHEFDTVAIEHAGLGRFDLTIDQAGAAVPDIAAFVVSQGWGLRELTRSRTGLEELFVALTCIEENTGGTTASPDPPAKAAP